MHPAARTQPVGLERSLVHHHIRTEGRRPTAEELRALREDGPKHRAVVPAPRKLPPASLPAVVRREVARLINTL